LIQIAFHSEEICDGLALKAVKRHTLNWECLFYSIKRQLSGRVV